MSNKMKFFTRSLMFAFAPVLLAVGPAEAQAETPIEAVAPTEVEPEGMCCDKWNGGTLQESQGGVYYAVVQKGLRKKTRTRVGDKDGYKNEEDAQAAADDAAEELNNG